MGLRIFHMLTLLSSLKHSLSGLISILIGSVVLWLSTLAPASGTRQVSEVKVKSLSRVPLFATPWTVAHQALPSMGFSRQEYWSGLPFPSPGDLPDPGIEPRCPALQADTLISEPPGKPSREAGTRQLGFRSQLWDFSGSPMVKTPCFHSRGCRFHPWLGN